MILVQIYLAALLCSINHFIRQNIEKHAFTLFLNVYAKIAIMLGSKCIASISINPCYKMKAVNQLARLSGASLQFKRQISKPSL